MSESFDATPIAISPSSIPRALEKATRYRLLNDPVQAESICLDVLEVEPDNQEALVTLILALTDQFGVSEAPPSAAEVREHVARLATEYQRYYYSGIVSERWARAVLRRSRGHAFAFEAFQDAMARFERAIAVRPVDDDDAVLRWNACVRTIRRHHLEPRSDEPETQLE
jgi:hypothetical protein